MRNKVLIYTAIVVIGFLSGYFSEPAIDFFSGVNFGKLAFWKNGWFLNGSGSLDNRSNVPSIKGTVSAETAIASVKALPEIKTRLAAAASQGTKVTFKADQAPSRDNPVWLLELREVGADKVPDIMFLKVDAYTGAVLNLRRSEVQVSGIYPGLPVSQLLKLWGNPDKIQKRWDTEAKKYNNIYIYKDTEISCDSQNLIDGVLLKGPSAAGPRGIKTGLGREALLKKLGKAEIAQNSLLIYSVLDDKTLQIHVKLDAQGRVSGLSILKG